MSRVTPLRLALVFLALFWHADERPALSREVQVTWTCCPPGETRIEEDTHDR